MNTFICSVFAFLSLASCNFINDVAGYEYKLVSPKYPITITLGIDKKGGYYGHALNRYFGTYKLSGNSVTFGQMASTKMAGTPDDMAAESKYIQSLSGDMEYEVKDNKLILKNAAGKELTYERIQASEEQK